MLPGEFNMTLVGQSKRLPGRPRRPACDGDGEDDGDF